MIRITTIVLAILLFVAPPVANAHTSALAAKKHVAKPARTTVVDVRRPTVIVFVPPRWALKPDEGAMEMIAHVRFAVGDVNKCKGATRIAIRLVFADRLALNLDGRRTIIDLSHAFPDTAGAYLLMPGKKTCAISTPNDTAFLGDKLSQAVGEFFGVPGCLQEGWSPPVCRVTAG